MRISSPPPNKATGRGSSLGPATTSQPPRRAGQRITSLSSVQELTGVERPDSRGSVNFSYPTGSRPKSPIAQRQLTSPLPLSAYPPRITSPTNQDMVYDPNSRRFIPAAQHYTIEQAIRDAANKPVKKKKKVAPQQFTGTHLADRTIGGRPRGTAVDAMETEASQPLEPVEQPTPAPPVPLPPPAAPIDFIAATPKKKKKKKAVVMSDSESDQASFLPNSSADESGAQSGGFNTRAGALLAKKPSVVREDREREEEEDETPKAQSGLAKLDTEARPTSPTPLPSSAAGRGHGRGQAAASAAFAQERQQTRSASQPAPMSPPCTPAEGDLASKGTGRVQSVSPSRTTHFATTPDNLFVKHQPPARSISPRKSALKRSNSPMGPFSADEGGSGVGHGMDSSETSNGSAVPSDELIVPRKKSVRVSFDDTNIVVGEAAAAVDTDSPVAQSPQQAKKSWFSLGRGKKKDSAVSEDDDEVMKPRPALPSFGSVRKNNNRESVEERPLVKPAEPVESADITPPALPSPPLLATSMGEVIEPPLGQSNDHRVGAILSQEASSKNAANISKSREPLPPQVLSVEGSGYSSDTDSSVSDQKSPALPIEPEPVEEVKIVEPVIEPEVDPSTINRESQTPTPTGFRTNGEVPEIAVLQATPTLEHTEKGGWPDMDHMPGGWGESSASDPESPLGEPVAVIEHAHTDPTTPTMAGITEPSPTEQQPGSPVLGDIAAENARAIPSIVEETEESDASVYSDAAEDLTDGEGDGFQSLNAVVESPVVASEIPGLAITTPPESPTVRTAKERAYKSQLSKKTSEPALGEGWEKTQEYWKGLSAERKRQLEEEARDEAELAEDSDSTIEAKPIPKPKKKRTEPVTLSAAEVPLIRQPIAYDRTYMIQPGAKVGPDRNTPVMRSSMRAEPAKNAQDPQIRKSMRGPGSLRGSLREDNVERGSVSKRNRPVSLPVVNATPASANTHVRNLSEASAAAAQGAAQRDMTPKSAPVLRRKGSGDSDSSFKRARRSNDGPTMRRSMRGSADERQQSPVRSSRFSLRSLSPPPRKALAAGVATSGSQTHMRSSLRGSVGAAPTLRGPKPEKTSRLPGFGRSAPSSASVQKTIRPRSSRFADSSDEEDARPAFRSRFVDSDSDSDDDVPAPRSGGFGAGTMRTNVPVRGIPKNAGAEDGDSSDLPDSDDEKRSPTSPGQRLTKKRQNGNAAPGPTLASGSLRRSGSGRETMASPISTTTVTARPQQTRRGSFMSILRRKKDPSSKVRKSDAESPARRDTPLERSKSDLAAVKRQESYTSTIEKPTMPKLQKKSPGWPLVSDSTPKITEGGDGRPSTADAGDGVVGGQSNGVTNGDTTRPDIGARRFTATGVGDVDLKSVGKGQKKKKFGALRRMFRLDD